MTAPGQNSRALGAAGPGGARASGLESGMPPLGQNAGAAALGSRQRASDRISPSTISPGSARPRPASKAACHARSDRCAGPGTVDPNTIGPGDADRAQP